ncbi:MAG: efflux transporter outer membrane subunit [Phycisphaerales bacterium]|nr:efflux transporter outer membrane subunit [Phycisphaerales bacterium]
MNRFPFPRIARLQARDGRAGTIAAPSLLKTSVAFGALVSLSMLPGCKVTNDYTPPGFQSPDSFNTLAVDSPVTSTLKGSPAALDSWWSTFNDPMLNSLVERAVASNLDIRLAEARIREARAQWRFVKADELPRVDSAGSYTRRRNSESSVGAFGSDESYDLFQAGFDASWELDLFGRVSRSVEAADADLAASVEARNAVLVSLLAELALNYIDYRASQINLDIAEKAVAAQESTLSLTESRFSAGLIGELDVARAKAQLETRRSQVPPIKVAMAQSAHRLATLLGKPAGALDEELQPPSPLPVIAPEIAVGVPADMLRRRPDVRRAERQLAAATARVGVATSELYPRLAINGTLGVQSSQFADLFDINSRSWSIGPSITWPVFDAGRVRANIAVQDARVEQSLTQYEQVVLASYEESENAMVGFLRQQSRRASLAASVDANRRALALAEQLYSSGLADFLNVLDAQRSLFVAEEALTQSEQAVVSNLISIYKSLGGGWESLAPSDAAPAKAGGPERANDPRS